MSDHDYDEEVAKAATREKLPEGEPQAKEPQAKKGRVHVRNRTKAEKKMNKRDNDPNKFVWQPPEAPPEHHSLVLTRKEIIDEAWNAEGEAIVAEFEEHQREVAERLACPEAAAAHAAGCSPVIAAYLKNKSKSHAYQRPGSGILEFLRKQKPAESTHTGAEATGEGMEDSAIRQKFSHSVVAPAKPFRHPNSVHIVIGPSVPPCVNTQFLMQGSSGITLGNIHFMGNAAVNITVGAIISLCWFAGSGLHIYCSISATGAKTHLTDPEPLLATCTSSTG
eukprot:gnl/MRDRNA2_/MRDRNA2_75588_c0_seq3.p1 gnl/MRDRNA2_/MRDRNA2_75588_c0~~gnl/MRDRNA2_/MRDRNA2_75588_c0_seq3.p1  ORF type:complete len:279 (+),score=55.89 gnl/MRDRNA2_/MRDRNA2_75588_c0_seq3:418-1254(+)